MLITNRNLYRYGDKFFYKCLWMMLGLCYSVALVSFSVVLYLRDVYVKKYVSTLFEDVADKEIAEKLLDILSETSSVIETITLVTTFNLSFTGLIVSILLYSSYKIGR